MALHVMVQESWTQVAISYVVYLVNTPLPSTLILLGGLVEWEGVRMLE